MEKEVYRRIEAVVGRENISAEIEDRICHSYDGTKLRAMPEAVVRPASTEEVSAILKIANETVTPVYARGAGSGLTGGAVPVKGGIVLDMGRMDRIIELDTVNLTATVEPGVVTGDFQREVEKRNLFYPPDPASADYSTMGGNVAECAGGLRGLKYGVTRDYVLSLEAVLASGEVIHTGARTYKSVTGYDLTRLLVGSEGTLCVFTKIMVRLIPLPPSIRTIFAGFSDFEAASETSFEIGRSGIVPRATEFMDETSVNSVRGYKGNQIPDEVKAILIVDVDGAPEATLYEANIVREIAARRGAVRVETAEAAADRERLWTARKAVSPALYTIAPNKLNHDICVPRSEMTRVLLWVDEQRPKTHLRLVCFGHIGEANMHVNIMYGHEARDIAEAERLTELLFRKVIDLGGTLTGEHGIGLKKMNYIGLEVPPRELGLMREIKRLFDPKGILNPGKMFPGA